MEPITLAVLIGGAIEHITFESFLKGVEWCKKKGYDFKLR